MNFIETAKRIFKEYLVLVMLAVLIVITMIAEPKFFTPENFTNIIRQFDPLSLGPGHDLCCVRRFYRPVRSGDDVPGYGGYRFPYRSLGQIPALLAGLSLGTAMGLFNSFMVISCGALTLAEALFITFGMSTLYGAFALIVTGGTTPHMSWLKSDISLYEAIGKGSAVCCSRVSPSRLRTRTRLPPRTPIL